MVFITKLQGKKTREKRYRQFRREADHILPHLNHAERDAWAAHAANTHRGFHARAKAARNVRKWVFVISAVFILISLALLKWILHYN